MEKALESYNSFGTKIDDNICTELLTSYYDCRTISEQPIFSKSQIKINLPEKIIHLTVSNNLLICLMSHQVLLRLILEKPFNKDEIFLEQYLGGYTVNKLFLDPSGNHLLIPLSPKATGLQPELLYLHRSKDKPKKIDKYRNHEITAVAFNHNDTTELSTGSILLGTSKGLIFESEFGLDEKLSNNWKQVFEINQDSPTSITAMEFYKVPKESRYVVFVSTEDAVYEFGETLKQDEKLVLQNIFTKYMNTSPKSCYITSLDVPNKFSKMDLNIDFIRKYPKSLAWLNESNIFFAKIKMHEHVKENQIINFPQNISSVSGKNIIPTAMVLTDFHVLLMYSDHITALCTLDQQKVYEKYFPEQFGVLLNIIKDTKTGKIYAYTSTAIFYFQITNEQRNVWKIYLERNEFSLAEKYAKKNTFDLDKVLCKKAELKFLEKDYIESAKIFSETLISFEKVCIKFLQLEDKKPLITYLNNKLNNLDKNDKTKITMLTIWIIELYLNRISKEKNNSEEQASLDLFLSNDNVKECCRNNYTVIYDLIASHGDKLNLTNLTMANKDFESVVNQHMNEGNLLRALEVIRTIRSPELFYKYCPILIGHYPKETISAILEQQNYLDPEKLIPTLISMNSKEHISEIIRYLTFAVFESKSLPIHNYFVKLLAEHDEEKLLKYLETQITDLEVNYDKNYALRVCEEHGAKRASVFLQCHLELWESAVELALTFDIELAKQKASQPNDEDLKRKLWLTIAEHEVKRKVNVKEVLKLLKECDLLKIEDILLLFDDFKKIDDFKDAICNALKESSLKIQEIQTDMDEANKAAECVNNELQSLRSRSMIISAQDKCAICGELLLKKPFFVFPCGHKFHSDCLETQIKPYLNNEENRKLNLLKSQLEHFQTSTILVANQSQMTNDNLQLQNNSREKIKTQIENILAADCLFCGVMIDSISKPFIEDDDWEIVNDDWL